MVGRALQGFDRPIWLGAAAAGVVLAAGLAGWGGSAIALSGADTTAATASNGTSEAPHSGEPATSAPTPGGATTTQPMASPSPTPFEEADPSSMPAGHPSATPQSSSVPPPPVSASRSTPAGTVEALVPAPSPQHLGEMDIAFVSPWQDSGGGGRGYYRTGLLASQATRVSRSLARTSTAIRKWL